MATVAETSETKYIIKNVYGYKKNHILTTKMYCIFAHNTTH